MKKLLVLILFAGLSLKIQAQDSLTLQFCFDKAQEHYANSKNLEIYSQIESIESKQNKSGYLPNVALNAQATYQSDVTAIDLSGLPFPVDIESPSKDQYKATIDITQVIYDGGITKIKQNITATERLINDQGLKVEWHELKSKVSILYFNILLLQEKKKILDYSIETLGEKLKSVKSGVENGLLFQSNEDLLKAEILGLKQQQLELDKSIQTLISSLENLMDIDIPDDANLSMELPQNMDNSERPELGLLDYQKSKIEQSKELLKAIKNPKLYSFGQLGYGKPGLNFLNNEFNPYYIVGLTFNWTIWDWNKVKYEQQLIDLNKNILENKKELLTQTIEIAANEKSIEIEKIKELIKQDKEIIALRDDITKSYESQLQNGTITTSEYLIQFNMGKNAKINLLIHKIQLVKAQTDQNLINGKL